MKNYIKTAILAVLVIMTAGVIIADTTFYWNKPQSTGTLTYNGLNITTSSMTSVTITNATLAGTVVMSGTPTTIISVTNNSTVYKSGGAAGWTGVITNKMDGYTNLTWVGSGIITNVTLIGALP